MRCWGGSANSPAGFVTPPPPPKKRGRSRRTWSMRCLGAGISRILIPPRFGGYGLGLDTWFEVVREIAKADASHGWCASLMIHHPHYVSQFSEEAQKAVWADGLDQSIAASIQPVGKIEPVEGGYRISGQFPFASGINHSRWLIVGALLRTEGRPDAGILSRCGPEITRWRIPGSRPRCARPEATPRFATTYSCPKALPFGCRICAREKRPAARCTATRFIARRSSLMRL